MSALTRRRLLAATGAGAIAAATPLTASASTTPLRNGPVSSSYDALILDHQPKHYYQHVDLTTGRWVDVIRGNHGRFPDGYGLDLTPNGELVPHFDGRGQHAEMAPSIYAGPSSARSAWTVECWVRFDTGTFPSVQGGLYVHWMGVGDRSGYNTGNHEWVARVYNSHTSPPLERARDRWVSGYAVSWHGQGLGCGQAHTDGWDVGDWHHWVFVVDHTTRKVALWFDGEQAHGWVSMDAPKYETDLDYRRGPLRVGTRDHKSYLRGAVTKVATYTYKLSPSRIREHYEASPLHPGAGCSA